MPASLSVRVSSSCDSSGIGVFTVTLINFPAGETVTVNMNDGLGHSYSATFPPDNSPKTLTGVANGTYIISASCASESNGSVYVNSSGTPSLDKEIYVNCTPVTPPPTTCDLELTGITLIPKTGATDNGAATVQVNGSGVIQYSLDSIIWQSSNIFTGLAPGIYTVYIRKAADHTCNLQEDFIINEVMGFTVVSAPVRDWLPVEQPLVYKFTVPMVTPEPAIVRVEVSSNGVDFNNPVLAGILNVLPDSSNQYTVNPAPYLAALFTPRPPVFGIDQNLFRLYRISIGRASVYDGTNTPELITTPARCLYATVYTTAESNGDIILSQNPTAGYNDDYAGILTKVDSSLQAVTNTATEAPETPYLPCPKFPIQLYWLNRSGGWQHWVFDGKHEYEDEVTEGVTWKDANDYLHTASVGPILQRVNAYSGFVNKTDFATIASVRYAIRVYHKDGNNWREVNIDRGSFPKYKAGDKRREVNFSFTYAEPLTVQNA